MLKKIKSGVIVIILFIVSMNSYADENPIVNGACYVRHNEYSEDGPDVLERSMNCIIEKKKSPYGTEVFLKFIDPKKKITHAIILESNKDCSMEKSMMGNNCPRINLYNRKKIVTSVFSDMTVYANNNGETEDIKNVFTKKTPNISTCSRYISMEESISVCYKPNAKNSNDVAKGF